MRYVKVRIACVVGSNGKWNAAGPCGDTTMLSDFIDGDDGKYPEAEKIYWILAELPIPEAPEIQGIVE